jgi:hypothetical protein
VPYRIIKKIYDVNYKVEYVLNGKEIIDTIHEPKIKPFCEIDVSHMENKLNTSNKFYI